MEQKKEFWRWKEYNWRDPDKDWKQAKIVTAGVDIGSVSSKVAVMLDGELYAYSLMRTGSDSPDSARKAMDWAIKDSGMALTDIKCVVGTGYGRVNVPFSQKAITEIACHARGANHIWGSSVRTVLDMGGQDCKAIKCDEKGKVTAFLMNDKCAAGTGRGMEVFADLLSVPIEEVGAQSLSLAEEPEPVSSTCVVFAKSEALGLLRQGWAKEKVLAAYCSAMAHRVFTLLEKVNVEKDFVITGGIAKNTGVTKRVEKELKITSLPRPAKFDPQLAGAIGAALFAKALVEREKR